jgi:hypothetical protein
MPWNARDGVGRLGPGIPSAKEGIGQVGCVYTAQGWLRRRLSDPADPDWVDLALRR